MTAVSDWQAVCQRQRLDDGETVEFQLGDTPGFAFRHQGSYVAFVNRCPHLGIELNWMPGRFLDADGHFIQCATHGALFTPDRGQCIAGPCQGEALMPLAIRCDGDTVLVSCPD